MRKIIFHNEIRDKHWLLNDMNSNKLIKIEVIKSEIRNGTCLNRKYNNVY